MLYEVITQSVDLVGPLEDPVDTLVAVEALGQTDAPLPLAGGQPRRPVPRRARVLSSYNFV